MSGVNIAAVVELRSSSKLPGVDWLGLLSLFSRTLTAKMPHLPQEKHFFICRTFFIMIIFLSFFFPFLSLSLFFFFFGSGEGPPEGIFSEEHALHIVHAPTFKVTLFKKFFFIILSLRQCSGRFWRQSGEFLSPGEVQAGVAAGWLP